MNTTHKITLTERGYAVWESDPLWDWVLMEYQPTLQEAKDAIKSLITTAKKVKLLLESEA